MEISFRSNQQLLSYMKHVYFLSGGPASLEEEYIKFLVKLGKQLVNVQYGGITTGVLSRLAEKCPDLRERFSFERAEDLKELINAAGKVTDLDLHSDDTVDLSGLSKILLSVKQLEAIRIYMSESPFGKLQFSEPMMKLKQLDVNN